MTHVTRIFIKLRKLKFSIYVNYEVHSAILFEVRTQHKKSNSLRFKIGHNISHVENLVFKNLQLKNTTFKCHLHMM